jgi:hypothetical protein
VIDEVHESLRALISAAFGTDAVTLAFEAPSAELRDIEGPPVVDFFLCDVREEAEGRIADWEPVWDDRGVVAGRRPPLRRFQLNYVVTVWASSPDDEYRTLGQLVRTLAAHDVLPAECLSGSLAAEPGPVPLRTGNPPWRVDEGWGMWAALGIPANAALHVAVTVPVRVGETEPAATAVQGREVHVHQRPNGTSESLQTKRRDGRIALRRSAAADAEAGALRRSDP